MLNYVEKARDDLGDDLAKKNGTGRRAAGLVTDKPLYPSDAEFPKGTLVKP